MVLASASQGTIQFRRGVAALEAPESLVGNLASARCPGRALPVEEADRRSRTDSVTTSSAAQ